MPLHNFNKLEKRLLDPIPIRPKSLLNSKGEVQMTEMKGGCKCGAVEFGGDVDVAFTANCHCTDCQQFTGAAFATLIFVTDENFSVSGKVSEYDHKSDKGSTLTKVFCPECGCPLFSKNSAREGMIGVRIGAIRDNHNYPPARNIFCTSALPSTAMDPDLPKSDGMPG